MKLTFEGKIEFDTEDSGAAKIAHIEGAPYQEGVMENGTFIRLHSWDDRAWDEIEKEQAHPIVKELEGKRVRITIEII